MTDVIMSLVSLGSDNKIFIWNVATAEPLTEFELIDIPLSVSWNADGSKFVVSCKDKKIRVVNPRSGQILLVSIKPLSHTIFFTSVRVVIVYSYLQKLTSFITGSFLLILIPQSLIAISECRCFCCVSDHAFE